MIIFSNNSLTKCLKFDRGKTAICKRDHAHQLDQSNGSSAELE